MLPEEKSKLLEELRFILPRSAIHNPPICVKYYDEYGNPHVKEFRADGAIIMLEEHSVRSSDYAYVVVTRGDDGAVRYAYAWIWYEGVVSSCGVEYYDTIDDIINKLDRKIVKGTYVTFAPLPYRY